MLNVLSVFYGIIFLFCIFFILTKQTYYNKIVFLPKLILLFLAFVFILLSFFYTNIYIDKYIVPILFLINICWAIYASITFKNINIWRRIMGIFLILFPLLIVDFSRLEIKKGLFINPDKNWIYLHTFFLLLWYILSGVIKNYSRLILSLVLLYPLLFPIEQWGIHRVGMLNFAVFMANYFDLTHKN